MIELKTGWWETKRLIFLDKGLIHTGSRTRLYAVLSRSTRATLGHIKWFWSWRKYAFYPLHNVLFEEECLFDIAAFIKDRSIEHKAPGLKKKEREKRIKRQIRYREEKSLTNKQKGDSIGSVEVIQPENGLVEGSQTKTPLEVELGTISF